MSSPDIPWKEEQYKSQQFGGVVLLPSTCLVPYSRGQGYNDKNDKHSPHPHRFCPVITSFTARHEEEERAVLINFYRCEINEMSAVCPHERANVHLRGTRPRLGCRSLLPVLCKSQFLLLLKKKKKEGAGVMLHSQPCPGCIAGYVWEFTEETYVKSAVKTVINYYRKLKHCPIAYHTE